MVIAGYYHAKPIPTTPVLVSQLVGGHESLLSWQPVIASLSHLTKMCNGNSREFVQMLMVTVQESQFNSNSIQGCTDTHGMLTAQCYVNLTGSN